MTSPTPLKISGTVQHYPWGKLGKNSIFATLAPQAKLDLPCAEIWFGTHPKGPATCVLNHVPTSLDQVLTSNPHFQSSSSRSRFGPVLPFLLKVLAIGNPLSIQAHPDLPLAALLHARSPNHYPDKNHKPEIAIALTYLDALAGFRPILELRALIAKIPEFNTLIPASILSKFLAAQTPAAEALKLLWAALMQSPPDLVTLASHQLYARLKNTPTLPHAAAILALQSQYPHGDPGLFCFFLLNVIHLAPGEAMYLGPNIPHAYLAGEIVECMANSDNVVRAAFTDKFKDVPTLIEMLDYTAPPPQILRPEPTSPGVVSYPTPAQEFKINQLRGPLSNHPLSAPAAQILLSTSARGALTWNPDQHVTISPGDAYFIPVDVEKLQVSVTSGELYIATTSLP